MAVYEVDITHVNEKKREDIFHEVVEKQGPPDGAVVVTLADGSEFDDDTIENIIDVLTNVGDIVLVR